LFALVGLWWEKSFLTQIVPFMCENPMGNEFIPSAASFCVIWLGATRDRTVARRWRGQYKSEFVEMQWRIPPPG
jgi:hypothetical protein